jgi:putative ABC transport system permease protein
MVIGSRLGLDGQALGTVEELTPPLRTLLQEPNAIILDDSELDRLGIKGVGDVAEITGNRVRVVGLVHGVKSIAGPYIFCSYETAGKLLRMMPGDTSYVLAKVSNPAEAPAIVERLRKYEKLSAFTSREFSVRSRMHWLIKTKAGIALGYAALLGLLVGGVVTSQTLFAATVASLREYAVLRALGIPRWRMASTVLAQSFWVGLAGVTLAVPTVFGLAGLADMVGARVELPWELLSGAVVVTMLVALLSGLFALRSLRLAEPAALLR